MSLKAFEAQLARTVVQPGFRQRVLTKAGRPWETT